MPSTSRYVGFLLTAVTAAAIAVLTLWPLPGLAPLAARTPVWCLVCGSAGVADVARNIVMFVPLGLGLGLAGMRARTAMIVAVLATLSIELLQLRIVSGRDASVSDLVTNTTGAALGLLLARWWRALVLPSPGAAAGLAAAWGAAVLAVLTTTGISVAPSMPGPPYWGQWTPELGGFVQHPGNVEAAVVEGIATPGRRIAESAALADSLADGEVSATVAASIVEPTAGRAPIFRLVNATGAQALIVAQEGTDLLVAAGTVAERTRIGPLSLVLPDALARPGAVAIEIAAGPRDYRVSVRHADGAAPLLLRARSVTWGWALFVPFVRGIGPAHRLFDALWMAGWLLPLGWWVAGMGGRLRGAALAGTVLVGGLAVVPALLGLPIAAGAAWAGGLAGTGGGAVAALLLRRRVTQITSAGSPL